MPLHLHLDFESFSKADITDVGAYRYAQDPSTEILCAAMAPHVDNQSDFNWSICESIIERDYEYLHSATDWPEYEKRVMDSRAEKLARWIESDPTAAAKFLSGDAAPRFHDLLPLALEELSDEDREAWESEQLDYAESHYRCPLTMELPL